MDGVGDVKGKTDDGSMEVDMVRILLSSCESLILIYQIDLLPCTRTWKMS